MLPCELSNSQPPFINYEDWKELLGLIYAFPQMTEETAVTKKKSHWLKVMVEEGHGNLPVNIHMLEHTILPVA